jgi:hypothetical protein
MKETGNLKNQQKQFQQYTLDKPNMKHLIRRILQDDTVAIQEQTDSSGGDGTWEEPAFDNDSGNVPIQSYEAEKINKGNGRYEIQSVSKRAFFKAVELLIKMKDANWFESNMELDDNPYYREEEMFSTLKILGIGKSGIGHKVFWAAIDNMKGIQDGTITNYGQLTLRAFRTYRYPMMEQVRVWKLIQWAPEVSAFDEDDARAEVIYDEDGYYHSGEWADKPGYEEEDQDWESEGAEQDGDVEVVETLYPEERGIENNLSEGRTKLTEGECPEDGCVQKRSKGWVVISNDTGKCWGRSKKGSDSECTYYKSEKSANGALSGYFRSK